MIKRGTARRLGLDTPRHEQTCGYPAAGSLGESLALSFKRAMAAMSPLPREEFRFPPVVTYGLTKTRTCGTCGFHQEATYIPLSWQMHYCVDGDAVTLVKWGPA